MIRRYRYLGDRLTDPGLIGRTCTAVSRSCTDGRCVTGRGSMLVRFEHELVARVVLKRRLRRVP